MLKKGINKNSTRLAYIMIWFVVFVWAMSPTVHKLVYQYSSPTVVNTIVSLVAFLFLLFYCKKDLRFLNKRYFMVAIPTGLANASGSILQKIGLLYTTPAQYAFLENLSCVAVPVLLFLFIRKKPSLLVIISSLLCLIGAFVLCGLSFNSFSTFGIGEILCALAGIVYGFNIAGTGCYAKNLKAPLYILIHMGVCAVVSFISMFIFNAVQINGEPITPIYFSLKSLPTIFGIALIADVLCWTLRTTAMKSISTTTVSVIMPFSAVIACGFSILIGTDTFSLNLLIGGIIIFGAILLSTINDIRLKNK